MKSMTDWPQGRVGLLNIVVILLLTNVLLLLALLTTDIRISQDLWWPKPVNAGLALGLSANTPAAPSAVASESSQNQHHALYPVNLDTTTLDTSRGELRTFKPHGIASHLFIEFGAYRVSPSEFSIVGLISKRLHDLYQPPYNCTWRSGEATVSAHTTWPIKPDWELGTMYGTMVVVCIFPEEVGTAGEGGSLQLSIGYPDEFRQPETFVVLTEEAGKYNASRWMPPFPYDITFCVSRLYNNVDAHRIREWLAYHAYLFGDRTHFLFHDAGGLSAEVYKVLKPWIDLGRVSVQNLVLLEIYQGRSHHQFSMLNDCLFRAQTLSNWTFFFDVDEYLYLPRNKNLQQILDESERKNVTQIRMKSIKMNEALCTKPDPPLDDATRDAVNARKWAIEKLVYANCDYGWEPQESRKYALKPRAAWATGVHFCEYLKEGELVDADENLLRLYHYHGTTPGPKEVCRDFTNGTNGEPNYLGVTNCTVDRTMTTFAKPVKQFELQTIGKQSTPE